MHGSLAIFGLVLVVLGFALWVGGTTYEAGGEQYVVMVAGGHHFMETPPGD
jgi:glucose dehydrogenase